MFMQQCNWKEKAIHKTVDSAGNTERSSLYYKVNVKFFSFVNFISFNKPAISPIKFNVLHSICAFKTLHEN